MLPRTLIIALLSLLPAEAHAQPASRAGDVAPASNYEATLTNLLQATVGEDGLVRYDRLGGPLRTDLRRVLKAVEDFDPATLTSERQKLAFWLNAYNVQMLWHVVSTPEVEDIVAGGFADRFFETPLRTAGLAATLNEIENVILRRRPGPAALTRHRVARLDPRLHAGLNCAAVSCPRLRRVAFTAANVEAELDAAFREFVASPRHFRTDGDRVVLTSLLDWYGDDFDRPGQPAGDFLLATMPRSRPGYARLAEILGGRTAAELRAHPKVAFEYDWTVNRRR